MKIIAPVIKVGDEFEIRVPQETDAYQLARVVNENRDYLQEWLPWLESSRGSEDSLEFIQKTQADWSIREIYTGLIYRENKIVGAIGLHSRVHRYMALGYWVSREFAGKGLCSLASRALIRWAFKHYSDLNLIELRAAIDNLASRRVAEKIGFKYEGVLREREWLYTRFVDHAIYSITRSETNQ